MKSNVTHNKTHVKYFNALLRSVRQKFHQEHSTMNVRLRLRKGYFKRAVTLSYPPYLHVNKGESSQSYRTISSSRNPAELSHHLGNRPVGSNFFPAKSRPQSKLSNQSRNRIKDCQVKVVIFS